MMGLRSTSLICGVVSGVIYSAAAQSGDFSLAEIDVSAGSFHTCCRFNGAVWCWGRGDKGQLGNGQTFDQTSPVQVEMVTDAIDVSAGSLHTCAVRSDYSVWCWGLGDEGQLGNGVTTDAGTGQVNPVQVSLSGPSGALRVSAGKDHTCVLRQDGSVWCWGFGEFGKLGSGTDASSNIPVMVQGVSDAVDISVGWFHGCALISDGRVLCWGRGDGGQLGFGGLINEQFSPTEVQGINDATAVSSGSSHTCAVRQGGGVWCWGVHLFTQESGAVYTLFPVRVEGLSSAADVDTHAAGYHACVAKQDGTLSCWGRGTGGRLGNGETTGSFSPAAVGGLTGALRVSAGEQHTCATKLDGTVWCWGRAYRGQLGNGKTSEQLAPVAAEVPGTAFVTSTTRTTTTTTTVTVTPEMKLCGFLTFTVGNIDLDYITQPIYHHLELAFKQAIKEAVVDSLYGSGITDQVLVVYLTPASGTVDVYFYQPKAEPLVTEAELVDGLTQREVLLTQKMQLKISGLSEIATSDGTAPNIAGMSARHAHDYNAGVDNVTSEVMTAAASAPDSRAPLAAALLALILAPGLRGV